MEDDVKSTNDEQEPTEAEQANEPETHAVEPALANKWQENAIVAKEANKEKFGRVKDFFRGYWTRKKWTVPVTIVALLVVLLAVPATRYPLLGTVIKKNFEVAVIDQTTKRPVTGATVSLAGQTGQTDNRGLATLHVGIGKHSVSVTKKYYKDFSASVFVGFTQRNKPEQLNVVATGRQVPVTVVNKITKLPVENAVIKAAGTETKTDKNGKATLVLPTKNATEAATVSAPGYSDASVQVHVTDQVVNENTFKVVPVGKLYFLSNQSGKIDVVRTDLDGSNRKVILAGTGSEEPFSTALLASRDWKYLALLSKRNNNIPGIYLIDTSSDNVTNIDEGNANTSFTLVGWSGDTFVYQVGRSNITNWQSGSQVLKSYDASAGKLYSIDQSQGEGTSITDYGFNSFSTVAILNNELVYAKNWYSSGVPNHLTGKNVSLISVRPDGSGKKSIKDFAIPATVQYGYSLSLVQYEPYSVYVQAPNGDNTNTYYGYENSSLTQKSDVTDTTFNKPYPTFLVSPSGKQSFWSDVRDGKNTLFVGDANAGTPKQIASLSEYTPYGWYSDDYLLVTVNGSELYVMPATGSKDALKVSNYYKPQLNFRGYGGGYGGF